MSLTLSSLGLNSYPKCPVLPMDQASASKSHLAYSLPLALSRVNLGRDLPVTLWYIGKTELAGRCCLPALPMCPQRVPCGTREDTGITGWEALETSHSAGGAYRPDEHRASTRGFCFGLLSWEEQMPKRSSGRQPCSGGAPHHRRGFEDLGAHVPFSKAEKPNTS